MIFYGVLADWPAAQRTRRRLPTSYVILHGVLPVLFATDGTDHFRNLRLFYFSALPMFLRRMIIEGFAADSTVRLILELGSDDFRAHETSRTGSILYRAHSALSNAKSRGKLRASLDFRNRMEQN